MNVHTLLCKADLTIALRCLSSFIRHSVEPFDLVVHDDGSLDRHDIEKLSEVIPRMRVIGRRDGDEQIETRLRHYPFSLRFRKENVFGLKLFDTTLLCAEPLLKYCDSDIYFFRPFEGLFNRPTGCDALFVRDSMNSYSLRSWQMARYGIRFSSFLNAGMMVFPVAALDLDRIEWFLSLPRNPIFKHFIEQSAWAMLASRMASFHWDAKQIRMVQGHGQLPADTVAGHFVKTFRKSMDLIVDNHPQALTEPKQLRSEVSGTIGAATMALEEVMRPIRRRFQGSWPAERA